MSSEIKKVVTYVVGDKEFKTEEEAVCYKNLCEIADFLEGKSGYNDFYLNKDWSDVLAFMLSCGLTITTCEDWFDQ